MSIHPLRGGLALAALVCIGALGAWRAVPQTAPVEVRALAGDDDEETALAKYMHTIEDGVRALRRSLRDPEKTGASLATLAEVQAAALAAKQEVPTKAAGLPEAERAAFVAAYRSMMIEFLGNSLALERALLEGDADAAKRYLGELRSSEDPGHERFTDDG